MQTPPEHGTACGLTGVVANLILSPQSWDLQVAGIILAGNLPAIDDNGLARQKR